MTIAGLLLIAILVIRCFPATPAAKWLHLHLVELPTALAAQLERRHLWFALILVLLLYSAAGMAPSAAEAALMAAWDVATYVDVVAVLSLTALLSRTRWLGRAMARRLPRLRRLNAARTRRPQPARRELPANDDGEDGRAAFRLVA